jgi:hypothetical protein
MKKNYYVDFIIDIFPFCWAIFGGATFDFSDLKLLKILKKHVASLTVKS